MVLLFLQQPERLKTPTYLLQNTSVTRIHRDTATIPEDAAKQHVGFLKVHKAASTTTQAILLRFGWKRNLTFVLPPEFNKFGFPNIISMYDPPNENNTLSLRGSRTFDVLCHHVIYGKEEWDKVLPEGYALIGTVRDPWELFKAMINYMRPFYFKKIKEENFIHVFLQDPLKYEPKVFGLSLTNNRMSFEFGVHQDIIKNRNFAAFRKYLEKLDKEFGVVIVKDRFDASLVLMKRYLRWSLEDILYISKNVKTNFYSYTFNTTHEDQIRFEEFCKFDRILYNFFTRRLTNQIIAEGPSFPLEVQHYKNVRGFVDDFCCKFPKLVKSIQIEESPWNPTFEINREDCSLLQQNELDFTQNIRIRQFGSALWTRQNRHKNSTSDALIDKNEPK